MPWLFPLQPEAPHPLWWPRQERQQKRQWVPVGVAFSVEVSLGMGGTCSSWTSSAWRAHVLQRLPALPLEAPEVGPTPVETNSQRSQHESCSCESGFSHHPSYILLQERRFNLRPTDMAQGPRRLRSRTPAHTCSYWDLWHRHSYIYSRGSVRLSKCSTNWSRSEAGRASFLCT